MCTIRNANDIWYYVKLLFFLSVSVSGKYGSSRCVFLEYLERYIIQNPKFSCGCDHRPPWGTYSTTPDPPPVLLGHYVSSMPDSRRPNHITKIAGNKCCCKIFLSYKNNCWPPQHQICSYGSVLTINWDDTIDENNVNKPLGNFVLGINKYVPLKKLTNREIKRTYKPWIMAGILNSVKRKDKLYNSYMLKQKIKTLKMNSIRNTKPLKLNSIRNTKPLKINSIRNTKPLKMNSIRNTKPLKMNSIRNTKPLTMNSIRNTKPLKMNSIRNTKPLKINSIRNTKPLTMNSIRNTKPLKINSNKEYKTIKNELHKEYKTLRNQVNELIRLSNTNYNRKYFVDHSNNNKNVWQSIKAIVNIKSKNYNSPTSIGVGNSMVTNSSDICNNICNNDYFATIAESILISDMINISQIPLITHLYSNLVIRVKLTC